MTQLSDILPFLKKCLPKKKNFKLSLKHALLKEMDIKFSKNKEIKALKEPFLLLGYGINAFFDLI